MNLGYSVTDFLFIESKSKIKSKLFFIFHKYRVKSCLKSCYIKLLLLQVHVIANRTDKTTRPAHSFVETWS